MQELDLSSQTWKKKREHILRKDKHIDQYFLKAYGIRKEANLVHHILPREQYPEYALADWNLISVSAETHKKILHEKYTGKLTKAGKALAAETAAANGIALNARILVCGLPGTGKSTWAKKNLRGGICYDLDAIAAAFRLTSPHKDGEEHAGARRMAAALRRGWLAEAAKYSSRIIIVRAAPDAEEMTETAPTQIIICTNEYILRTANKDRAEILDRLRAVVRWADVNGVNLEYTPPGTTLPGA